MCVRLSAALLDGDRDRDRRRRGTDYGDEAWGHRLEMEMEWCVSALDDVLLRSGVAALI